MECEAPPQGVVTCNFNPDILESHVYKKSSKKTVTLQIYIQKTNLAMERLENLNQNLSGAGNSPRRKRRYRIKKNLRCRNDGDRKLVYLTAFLEYLYPWRFLFSYVFQIRSES